MNSDKNSDEQAQPLSLAKLIWNDPASGITREYVLTEGATATIGRLEDNDITIKEQHVSRQHAVINYRDGVFVISDLGSGNGTYVNNQRLTAPFPLASGDEIRLYVPTLLFSAVVTAEEQRRAEEHGTFITAVTKTGRGRIMITTGPQEGENIPLLVTRLTIGRATASAEWEVRLQDPSVSRPHARMELAENHTWIVYDLGSANGTTVNGKRVDEKGRELRDGDVVAFGSTLTLFRIG